MKTFIASISLFCVLVIVSSCPKHEYYYQVVEIQEPNLRLLGDYILVRLKKEREQRADTCNDALSVYLAENPMFLETFDATKMARIFMHQMTHAPKKIFYGIDDTERMLKSNCAYNILVTADMNIHKYLVQNGTKGDLLEVYTTEEGMLENLKMKGWETMHALQCYHYLYHVSTQYRRNAVISITVINKNESDEQLQFSTLTTIGGFVKDDCKEFFVDDNKPV